MTGEDISKAASGVVESLKSQPGLLVIVVLNVLMLIAQMWTNGEQHAARAEIVSKLIDQCGKKGD